MYKNYLGHADYIPLKFSRFQGIINVPDLEKYFDYRRVQSYSSSGEEIVQEVMKKPLDPSEFSSKDLNFLKNIFPGNF